MEGEAALSRCLVLVIDYLWDMTPGELLAVVPGI
jgi:hypothetical protein